MKLDEDLESTVEPTHSDHGLIEVVEGHHPGERAELLHERVPETHVQLERVVVSGALNHPVVVEVGRSLARLRHAPRGGGEVGELEAEIQRDALALEAVGIFLDLPQRLECASKDVPALDQIRCVAAELFQILLDLQVHRGPCAIRERAELPLLPPFLDAERDEDGEHHHHRLGCELREPPAHLLTGERRHRRGHVHVASVASRHAVRLPRSRYAAHRGRGRRAGICNIAS